MDLSNIENLKNRMSATTDDLDVQVKKFVELREEKAREMKEIQDRIDHTNSEIERI